MTQATIDIRLANMQKMEQHKFNRLLAILQTEVEKAFSDAIVRVRPSQSMSDVSVFGLGKKGKMELSHFLKTYLTRVLPLMISMKIIIND